MSLCKHKGPCVHNAVRGLIRGLVAGYGIKAGLNLALGLVFKKIWKRPEKIKEAVTEDPVRFALFIGGVTGGYKALNCLMRAIRKKDDGWNSFIAGALAGSAMLFDTESRRRELTLYVLARAAEAIFNSCVMRGWIRPIPFGETILFCLFCGVIMYSFVYEPDNLPSGYVRWIMKFTGGDDHLLYKLREVHKLQAGAASVVSK